MSEQLEAVVDPDVPAIEPPAPDPQAQEPPPDPVAQASEEDIPEAVEVQPGVRVVPVGVVQAQRQEIKALKAQAQRATELEREAGENRAIVEFIKANPQILQGQQQQPQRQEPNPQDDPALVEYAKTLDLYTQDGRPDTARASKLRDMTRQEAQSIAQQTIAPMQEASHAQQAAQNLQWMASLKDANNQPLEEQYIIETVRSVYGNMPRADAIKILADPNVAQVLADTALGRQARMKKTTTAVPAPQAPALHVEAAGGGTALNVSDDHVRRLGISPKQYQETGKKYQPGRANSLE